MANQPAAGWLTEEVADFLASCPSREALLAYRPSARLLERFNALLDRSKTGGLSADEEWELRQFEYVEMLMQAVKARLRSPKTVRT